MASEFIEILSPSVLKDLQTANAEIVKLISNIDKAGQSMQKITVPSQGDSAIKNLNAEYLKQEKAIQSLQKQLQSLGETKAKTNQRTSEEIVNQRALAQSADRQTRATSALVGAYANLNAKHQQAKKNLQDITVAGKNASETQSQYNKRLKDAQSQFSTLNTKILAADKAVGVFNRNVGNYPNRAVVGIKNLASAFGLFSGVYLFAQIMRDAFSVLKDFDKATADLAATLGKSRKEIINLTEDAKRLGAITNYTASEITGLQKELGKLGFSQTEILAATEGVQNLASAVDTDLSNAAAIAGITLRQFGLNASEMNRVVDVMAKSFTTSALDISKFQNAMKYVGPDAAASNVTLEQTSGLLAVLADNGISGSKAGTSLRRIMTDIVKTGKPFNVGLREMVKSGISVADAFDEVGRTAQTSLVVLGKNMDKVEELTKVYDNAAGTVKKMADEQLNSLQGDIKLLTSAWDGFILSINSGDGAVSRFFRTFISGITDAINLLSLMNADDKKGSQIRDENKIKGEKQAIEDLNKVKKEGLKTDAEIADYAKLKREYAQEQIDGYEWELNALKQYGKEQAKIVNDQKKNNPLYGNSSVYANAKKELDETNAKVRQIATSYGFYKGVLKGYTEQQKQTNAETKSVIKLSDAELKALEKLREERLKDAFARGISDLERQIEINNQRIDLDTTYTEEKLILLEKNAKLEKEINEKTYLENLRLHKHSLDLQLIDANNYRTKSEKNEKDHQERILKLKKDNFQAFLDYREKYGREANAETFGEGVTFLPTEKLDELVKGFKTLQEDGIKRTKEEIEALKKASDDWVNSFQTGFFSDAGLPTLFKVLNDEIVGFGTQWEETFLAISEITQEALAFLTQSSNAYFDNQLNRLGQQKDIAIAFAGESSTAKEEIERQYEEKSRRLRRQQAQEEKKLAIFNIAIDTAQAIVASLKTDPTGVMAIIIGAIGALQAGIVSNTPLPQFEKGTDNAPEGWAYTQEKGREIITDKSGKVKSLGNDKGAQLTYLNKGDKVFKNSETEKLMFDNNLNSMLIGNGIAMPKIEVNNDMSQITNEIKSLSRIVANKEGLTITKDAKGYSVYQRKQAETKKLMNNVLTYKGYDI
jgi:hypothetical protein